jgi:hypothetical protein
MAKTFCVLMIDWGRNLIAYWQKTANEYLSPSEAVPTGKAD